MRHTETITSGARCPLRVLPSQASSHQTGPSKSTAWTYGKSMPCLFLNQLLILKPE